MGEVNEEITIAQNRADEIIFENASVFVRSKLYEALPGSDEEKLKNYTNTNDFWPIQSGAAKTKDKEEIENARKHYKEEMLPRPAMFGEGENRKFRCPSMNIGFTTIIRQDVVTSELRSKEEPPLFGEYNGLPIFPLQGVIAEAFIKHKLIATKPMVQGCHFAEPVPLSSSMARLENGEWVRFDPADMQLPTAFLNDCYDSTTKTKITKIYNKVADTEHVYLKEPHKEPTGGRRNVGTIAILCGTYFESLDDLDTHMETMHGGYGLSAYPKAVPVKKRASPTTSDTAFVSTELAREYPGVIKIRGAQQGTIAEFAKSNRYRRITETDTLKDVNEKLLEMIMRIKNDFEVFNKDGTVDSNYWGDVIECFKNLFDCKEDMIRQFEMAAMSITDRMDMFNTNCKVPVTLKDMEGWMTLMWTTRSTMTLTRKISLLMHNRVHETSNDLMLQYDAATRLVKKYLGTKVELVLPGKSSDDQAEAKPTLVDTTHLLAILLTSDLWSQRNLRFWEVMKKEEMDKVLFPTSLKGETQPPKTSTLHKGLHAVQEKLKVDTENQQSLPPGGKAVCMLSMEDEDVPEDEIGDDFTEDKINIFQESINRGLKYAHVQELAVTLNMKQVRTLRARNKKIFQRDSVMKRCGRDRCANPENCYNYRKGKQQAGKAMYITWSCGSIKNPPKQKQFRKSTTKKKVNAATMEIESEEGTYRMIPMKDRKEVTLVQNPGKGEFRIASPFDKIDLRLPKLTAQLGGTEKIGKQVNQLLAIPLKNQPKVNSLSIVPIKKTKEQNNYPKVSCVSYNENKEKSDNEDENEFRMKTEIEDPKDNTDRNFPNAAEEPQKSSEEHLKEERIAKPIQDGKINLSQRKRIKEAITKFNHDLAERASNELENVDKRVIERIKSSGMEKHDDLSISDFKQYYEIINNHQDNPGDFSWRHVDWIFSPMTTLTPTQKIEQISTAVILTGHGSAVHDLKELSNIDRGTPCSPELIDYLCDCQENAACDLGKGRGNPENICIGHKCWGIATNLPRDKITPQMLQLWMDQYGCELKSECPLGFCIHIKDSIIENEEEVSEMIREVKKYVRHDDRRITSVEKIRKLSPPPWMRTVSDLKVWRCTASREYEENTTTTMDQMNSNAGLPLPHTSTPTPSFRSSVVQVMTLQSTDEDTYQGQTLDSDGHPTDQLGGTPSSQVWCKSRPPEAVVTLPKEALEEQHAPRPGCIKEKVKMAWSGGKLTPLGQVIAICIGILTLMAGAAIFGGVTNKIISDDERRRYRRGANISTPAINEQGIAALFDEAREKKLRIQQQDAIAHPGQIPIRIFTDQLVVIAFEQNLKVLESHVKSAINYLKEAQFSFNDCQEIWGDSYMEKKAQEICADRVTAINRNIRAALYPVERAFWNLKALCDVDIRPSIFSTLQARTKRGATPNKKKPETAIRKKRSSIAKRELFTIAAILIGVIGTFASGGIVALAMRGQEEKRQINLLGEKVEEIDGIVDIIYESATPMAIMNTETANSGQYVHTATLLANEVNDNYGDLTTSANGGTKLSEKSIATALTAVIEYTEKDQSRPNFVDADKKFSAHRQMCMIAMFSESSRKGRLSRSTCEEVTVTQQVICAVPAEIADNEHIFPHPHYNNAYLDDREHAQHGWTIFSNPYLALQPVQDLPTDGYRFHNLGRRLKARSGVIISFLPHQQVMADRMVFKTEDKTNLDHVFVKCHLDNNTMASQGYINIFYGEDITLGWNCEMTHHHLDIPRMTRGVMQSINEDTNDSRVRRGELPFSIQARNGTGHSIIGFANDRILKQFKKTKKTPSWKWSVVSKDGTIHLPTLLAIVVAALGILVIFAICIKYKITRKIGWECCSERQRIEDSDSTSSTATTSEHVYSNDD